MPRIWLPGCRTCAARWLACWTSARHRAITFLDRIEEWLHETHQPSAVVRRMKPTFARPAPEDMRKELEQQCDLIIEALAD